MHPFRPASVMNANRFDEGYSEDTRSQNETDMVMGAGDSGMEAEGQQFSLPDWIMGLDEQQRSGMLRPIVQSEQTANVVYRNCIRYSTIVTDLIDSWDR
jgi:F-box and WD-40 domain protein 1/11